jgi:hypothetical protein
MIGSGGEQGLKALGNDRKAYRQEIHERLQAVRSGPGSGAEH